METLALVKYVVTRYSDTSRDGSLCRVGPAHHYTRVAYFYDWRLALEVAHLLNIHDPIPSEKAEDDGPI